MSLWLFAIHADRGWQHLGVTANTVVLELTLLRSETINVVVIDDVSTCMHYLLSVFAWRFLYGYVC